MQRQKISVVGNTAQISLEFVIIFALLLLVFVVFLSAFQTRRAHVRISTNVLAGRNIGDRISDAITRVLVLGDGATEKYYVPSMLQGSEAYSITIHNTSHLLRINWSAGDVTVPLVTARYNATTIPVGETIRFSNDAGMIGVSIV
ncbi:MAG: hypothetical protein ACOCWQ_01370 [Nanoarchaeota archaeon]